MPKVSICLPTYEQTEFLKKTLDSIIIQSFNDYELIITDDSPGSTVSNLLKGYDFKGRLRYYYNQPSLGSPQNWNYCISKATGNYIKIMHHDDWFNGKDSLKTFVETIESANAWMVFSNTEILHADTNQVSFNLPSKNDLLTLSDNPIKLFTGNFIGAPSVTIFKNDPAIVFDENLKWLVDVDFYIRFLTKHPHFVHIDEFLVTTITAAGHSVTNECYNNKEVELFENFYLFNKSRKQLNFKQKFNCYSYLMYLLWRFDVLSLDELKAAEYRIQLPQYFSTYFKISRWINLLKKWFKI